MKFLIVEEPIFKHKLIFKEIDFVILNSFMNDIEKAFNPVLKVELAKKLLKWMYKNAYSIIR